MGKASRNKRERKDPTSDLSKAAGGATPRKPFPVFWTVIGVIIIGGIVALIATKPDPETNKRQDAAKKVPVYADVEVDGTELPVWSGDGTDGAIGDAVPTLSGTSMADKPLTLTPGGGTALVYSVMAHWCPHCNVEVPRILEWVDEQGLPDGVEIVGVSTSADKGQANFPPAVWLAGENWKFPTLIDDELGTASKALGTSSFPNLVFVDADGKVVKRYAGEMPTDEFAAAIKEITPAAAS